MREAFSRFARAVNAFCANPLSTVLAFLAILAWAVAGTAFHFSDGWQLVANTGTTLVTFLMVFILASAQQRDTSAVQAKLDELLRAIETADNRFIALETKPEAIAQAIHKEVCEAVNDA